MHRLATGQIFAAICCMSLLPQLLYRSVANGQHQPGDETCETLPSEIHLIKGLVPSVVKCVSFFIELCYFSSRRGIRRVGSPVSDLQWRCHREQVRRQMQQPGATVCDHRDRVPQRVLLLSGIIPAGATAPADPLLRPGWCPHDRPRIRHHGDPPQGTDRL